MSDTDRVLAALVKAGPRGLTRIDFEDDPVIDGGKKILRLAARIEELRNKRGAKIDSTGRRSRVAVYVLESVRPGTAVNAVPAKDDAGGSGVDPAVVPEPTQLFDLTMTASPRTAIFDDWEEVA